MSEENETPGEAMKRIIGTGKPDRDIPATQQSVFGEQHKDKGTAPETFKK